MNLRILLEGMSVPTIGETFESALQHHQAGDLQKARDLYCQVLESNPDHAGACHLLGVLAHQIGQHQTAIQFIRKAIAIDPESDVFHSNLGAVWQALGQLAEAEASYRQALRLNPGSAEAHNNLGVVLADQGKPEDAAASYGQAIQLRPSYAMAHNNLGNVYKELGKLADSVSCFREALRLEPTFVLALSNLGNVLRDQGNLSEALACYGKALQLKPDFAEGYNNLGSLMRSQGKLPEAVTCYHHALRLQPDLPQAHNNLGIALMEQGRLDEAMTHYRRSVSLRPDDPTVYSDWGVALTKQGKLDEAVAEQRQALRLKPSFAEAHNELGNALVAQGKLEEALASYREALSLRPDFAHAHSNLLFCLNYDPDAAGDFVFEEHCRWGKMHGQAAPPAPHQNKPDPKRRLRIGYVSPDFRLHPVAAFFAPILNNHDPAQVEAICYADVRSPDDVTKQLQAMAHGWHSICGQNDSQAAQQVRADGIDILVDLAGHTAHHRLRLFARRPAPLQVTYLGYPNTTGLTSIDYRLTDAVLDPPGEPPRATEQLLRLPEGFCCFAPPRSGPEVTALPALTSGRLTFGSLHNLAKLNPAVIDLWCRVLQAVPSARLLLFRDTLAGGTREHIERQFALRGVSGERLELRHEDARGYLGAYGDIDISLDVFPWTGHAVSCESLWMGVPVLTWLGTRSAWRLTASVLTRLGLTEWLARTPEQYVALAVRHAADREGLARLRSELRGLMSKRVCDGRRFTQGLEQVYRDIWHKWCAARSG